MALTLENEFTVDAGVEQTWALLLDLSRVAGCLPGAVIDQPDAEGNYAGTMKVKLGPVAMTYNGVARMTDVDETARVVTFRVQGKETRGQGTASATVRSRLEEADGVTRVHVQTELSVTGRPAQFGRGIMQDVAARMLSDFAACLSQRLAVAPDRKDENVSTSESGDAARAAARNGRATTGEPLDLSGVVGGVMMRRIWRALGLAALTTAVLAVVRRRKRSGDAAH